MATNSQSIQEKYTAEALKRLRPDGLSQFQDAEQSHSTRFRSFAQDIWADHEALDAQLLSSPTLKSGDKTKFLIAGAGISGIVSAVRLILAGFDASQIRIVETAGGVGGTWYWNRYPGLHCDVESYVYMPLLEEMGYMPSHKYASGVEIRKYLNQVVQKYQLLDKILFRTKMERLAWDDQRNVWKADLVTSHGSKLTHKEAKHFTVEGEFVILTAGYLTKPQIPKLDGASLDVFTGDMFHTARWDYSVTGGSAEDTFPSLDKLKGKRVGIIGTGATAIQIVPCLAEYAKELYVFQRTPSAVFSRGNGETDAANFKANVANSTGWHKSRMENLSAHMANDTSPGMVDLVGDEWTKQRAYAALTGDGDPRWANMTPDRVPELIAHYLEADSGSRERLRERVTEEVSDQDDAAKLTPWYPIWCKRPTFSDTYLQAFNKPNVHLVDTEGRGVDAATPTGLKVKDTEYQLDVLVLSTGYISPAVSGGDPAMRTGVEILGREGRSMPDKWAAQGLTSLHGVSTNGFPNLFWIGANQGAASANLAHVIDSQSRHIAYIVASAHETAAAGGGPMPESCVVEVETDAENAWTMRVMQGAIRMATTTICTPGYMNNEGAGLKMAVSPGQADAASQKGMMNAAKMAPWGEGMMSYLRELDAFRQDGKLPGFRVEAV